MYALCYGGPNDGAEVYVGADQIVVIEQPEIDWTKPPEAVTPRPREGRYLLCKLKDHLGQNACTEPDGVYRYEWLGWT